MAAPRVSWFPLLMLSLASVSHVSEAANQPNIVFVLTDDQGWEDIGYHGSKIRTPVMDRLSAEGVRLENYYVQPICTPTRASLLVGRYETHTGVHTYIKPAQPYAMPDFTPLISTTLKTAGYQTSYIGKWHLGFYKKEFLPRNRGWDYFYGMLIGASGHFSHKRNGRLDLYENETPDRKQDNKYSTTLFTEKAQDVIRNHDSSQGPMFLFLSYQAPHDPLEVPESYLEEYAYIKNKNRRKYAGMITCMDEYIGKLVDTLKETGMWENTVFIFSSDNGGVPKYGGNNWPLRGHKGTLWEGGIRAPAFVTSPLLQKTGYNNTQLMHVSDWYPTLAGLAGAEITPEMKLDGVDQWAMISEGATTSRTMILHSIEKQWKQKGDRYSEQGFDTRTRAAIRVGNYKLITGDPDSKSHGKSGWIPPPEMEPKPKIPKAKDAKSKNVWLFNLEDDPNETNDLSEEEPEKVAEMLELLEEQSATVVSIPYPKIDKKGNPKKGQVWGPWIPEREEL